MRAAPERLNRSCLWLCVLTVQPSAPHRNSAGSLPGPSGGTYLLAVHAPHRQTVGERVELGAGAALERYASPAQHSLASVGGRGGWHLLRAEDLLYLLQGRVRGVAAHL